MRLNVYIVSMLLATASLPSLADQYRSRQLQSPQATTAQDKQSIAELERGIASLNSAYSKASTARFLARHYVQKGMASEAGNLPSLQQAIEYYRQALTAKDEEGEGLSIYAKQEAVLELSALYFYLKDYAAFLKSLQQYIGFSGKLNRTQQLQQATALYHVGKKHAAIATAEAIFRHAKSNNLILPLTDLSQLLFIFYHSEAYVRSAKVQRLILQQRPGDVNQWLRLSQIYLRNGQQGKAADTLLTALQNDADLADVNLQQLTDLLAVAGVPYAAASWMQGFLTQGQLSPSVARYERLFQYWYRAQEIDKAIAALAKAAELEGSVERFLNLAELYHQQQQWSEMQSSILSACADDVADEYVSRANLLLGISELKLGNEASARQAFINATLVGGRGDAAAQYLRFMQAPAPTEKELSSFYGPCKPSWASGGSRGLTLVGMQGFAVQGGSSERMADEALASEQFDFSLKTVADQTLVLGQYRIAITDMEKKLQPLAMKLGMSIMKSGGNISGPMHFIFPQPIVEGATEVSFQMAFPVSKKPRLLGRYKAVDDSGYYCATTVYEGSLEGLVDAWARFYQAVSAAGHQPTGSARQLVIDPPATSKEAIKLELQMGLLRPDQG